MSGVACADGTWQDPLIGRRFAYRLWQPPSPRALLVLIHGFGEHGGRYHPFASALAERGIFVAAPDLWGHGRSEGQRGDVAQMDDYLRQVTMMADQVFRPASSQAQYTLFGHSVGGLVAILLAMGHPPALARAVIQSPLLEVGFPVPWWKKAAATVFARAWPTFPFSMNLDVGALTHDPAVIRAYQQDPLVHNAMSARTYRAIRDAQRQALAGAAAVRAPILLLCGAQDRIVAVEAAQRWWDRLSCEKRRVTFPDCYHELHHEAVQEEVLRLTLNWTLEKQGVGSGDG